MKTEKVMFGAGCFWGVQYYFDQIPGVVKTTVGYSGGHSENPSYEEVCSHTTGHAEVTLIEYDPKRTSFETLVKHFFRMHDATQVGGQGPDIGDQYRSAIYYYSEEQKQVAEKVKNETQKTLEKPITTELTKASAFYPAEEYHQKYTEKTGMGMCHVPYTPIN